MVGNWWKSVAGTPDVVENAPTTTTDTPPLHFHSIAFIIYHHAALLGPPNVFGCLITPSDVVCKHVGSAGALR